VTLPLPTIIETFLLATLPVAPGIRVAADEATLGDDSLIDAYHQAWEDHRDARAEGSDNLDKAGAEGFATETAMRARFHDYRTRYNERYPSLLRAGTTARGTNTASLGTAVLFKAGRRNR
jgi:hypothetical protein